MAHKSLQQAALQRASDLAEGVGSLSHKVGVSSHDLRAMLEGAEIPQWLFLRLVDYINEAEALSSEEPTNTETGPVRRNREA